MFLYFCVIASEEQENHDLFVFPKEELIKRAILTTKAKEEERSF